MMHPSGKRMKSAATTGTKTHSLTKRDDFRRCLIEATPLFE